MKILFDDVLIPTQKMLYSKIGQMFGDKAVCRNDSYILVQGEAPVMLVAHMDTVHKEPVRQICKSHHGTILMSPQGIGGDDRCGVYALLKIHHDSEVKPWLLFTCDEEVGGIGARQFCSDYLADRLPEGLDDMKLLIEIDRKGENDAVYYDCDNSDFEKYIESKGFKTKFGSFSDISIVAPAIGVAAVNLSSGYYNAHTLHEYIDTKQLNATITKVKEIVKEANSFDFPKYEYIESISYPTYGNKERYSYYGYDYRDYDYEAFLKNVPDEILDECIDLLELYSPEELKMIRSEYGDAMIHELWEYEFFEETKDNPFSKSLHDMTDEEFIGKEAANGM